MEEERKALKRFMKHLKTYIKSKSKAFPSKIYTDVVNHAAVYKDGSIVYHLRFGLELTIDEVYATFQEQCEAQRWAKVKAKHEAFLRGPEVAALLEYCHEPRTVKEMLERFLRKRENFREYLYQIKVKK